MARSRNMKQRGESKLANFYEWRKICNMGMGSCGIFSLIQALLVMRARVHPSVAEKTFSPEKARGVQPLVGLCRQTIVRAAERAGAGEDGFFTDGRVTDSGALAGGGEATDGYAGGATDREELHTIGAWMDGMLKHNEQLDFRAMMLLAEALKIKVQIVTQMTDGENSVLRDVDGWATPPNKEGCIL